LSDWQNPAAVRVRDCRGNFSAHSAFLILPVLENKEGEMSVHFAFAGVVGSERKFLSGGCQFLAFWITKAKENLQKSPNSGQKSPLKMYL